MPGRAQGLRGRRATRRATMFYVAIAGVALTGALLAVWVIPYRLATTGARSHYACFFVGDEGFYASRVQPLLAGACATNTVNGVRDPAIVSMFFLEDALRAVITATNTDVIAFVWGWRYVFPVALLGVMMALACATLPRPHKVWSLPLCYAAAAAGFVLLYVGHELLVSFPPVQGWLHRFPTNIEFPLSAGIAWALIRFADVPSTRRGVVLALVCAATTYLRIYAALPWAMAVPIVVIWHVCEKRVSWRVALATLAALLLAMTPWIGLSLWNGRSPTQAVMVGRTCSRLAQYAINQHWPVCFAMAAIFGLATAGVEKRQRPFLAASAASMVVLPLAAAILPFANQLMYDRFCLFYLVVLAAAGLLVLGRRSRTWRGAGGMRKARRWTVLLACGALACSWYLAAVNWRCDFARYALGPYASVAEELKYLPAYEWIRGHTPETALFLCDDGSDCSDGKPPRDERTLTNMLAQGDLFQIVARRRRVWSERLFAAAVSEEDLLALQMLHRLTFGFPSQGNPFLSTLKRFRPDCILVRKDAPAQRGMLPRFKPICKVLYADAVCEVWEIPYGTEAPPSR